MSSISTQYLWHIGSSTQPIYLQECLFIIFLILFLFYKGPLLISFGEEHPFWNWTIENRKKQRIKFSFSLGNCWNLYLCHFSTSKCNKGSSKLANNPRLSKCWHLWKKIFQECSVHYSFLSSSFLCTGFTGCYCHLVNTYSGNKKDDACSLWSVFLKLRLSHALMSNVYVKHWCQHFIILQDFSKNHSLIFLIR